MSLYLLFPNFREFNIFTLSFRNSHLEKDYLKSQENLIYKQSRLQLCFFSLMIFYCFILETQLTESDLWVLFVKLLSMFGLIVAFFVLLKTRKRFLQIWIFFLNLFFSFFFLYEMKMFEEMIDGSIANISHYKALLAFCFISYQREAMKISWMFKSIEIIITFLLLLLAFESIEFNAAFFLFIFLIWFSLINAYLNEKQSREKFAELQDSLSLVDKYTYILKEADPGINILLKQVRKCGSPVKKNKNTKDKKTKNLVEKNSYEIEYINTWAKEKHSLDSFEKVMDFFHELYIKDSGEMFKKTPEIVKTVKNYLEYINNVNKSRASIDLFPAKSYFCYRKLENDSNKTHKYYAIFCIYEWKSDIYVLVRLNDVNSKKEIKELKELDNFKNKLLANITHDLRTPLNGMIYFINQAKENIKNEIESRKLLSYAEINGNLLLNLIGDILDHSLLKANKMRLNIRKFCLKNIIDEIMVLLKPKAEFQSIKLLLLFLCKSDLILESDSDRLKQVLINLVSNAIKFTQRGFVKIRVYKKSEKFINFEVIDTGIGISKEDALKLGTPFNTYNPQGLNGKGIGLGLCISKEIIGKLGPKSELFISSAMGKGSKFAFTIFRSLNLKENVGPQKMKINLNPLSKNKEFTFEKLTIMKNTTNIPLEQSFSQKIFENAEDDSKNVFSEIDSQDLKIDSEISMNFLTEDIDEKINNEEENKDLSPTSVRGYFERRTKKRTMVQLNKQSSLKKIKIQAIVQSAKSQLVSILNKSKQPLKVLIVDDNHFNILIMEKFFQKLNTPDKIVTEYAHNGEVAVEKFKQSNSSLSNNPYIITIMDCEMPIMNGFEAASEIVKLIEQKDYKSSRIIAYSALNLDSEIKKCEEHGMKYFLCKPCNESELFEKVVKCLKDLPYDLDQENEEKKGLTESQRSVIKKILKNNNNFE